MTDPSVSAAFGVKGVGIIGSGIQGSCAAEQWPPVVGVAKRIEEFELIGIQCDRSATTMHLSQYNWGEIFTYDFDSILSTFYSGAKNVAFCGGPIIRPIAVFIDVEPLQPLNGLIVMLEELELRSVTRGELSRYCLRLRPAFSLRK